MKLVFAIFDVKAESYGSPIFLETPGLALRSFSDACADEKGPFFKYPADYSLYEIGSYDPNGAVLKGLPQPKFLYSATAVVNQLKMSQEDINLKAIGNGVAPKVTA